MDFFGARVQRLEELIERLDQMRQSGEAAYLADEQQRAATERWLQVAIRICIIPSDLAHRLAGAARQHDLIMHMYVEIDDGSVFASLAVLDDLRDFAASLEGLAHSDDSDATPEPVLRIWDTSY